MKTIILIKLQNGKEKMCSNANIYDELINRRSSVTTYCLLTDEEIKAYRVCQLLGVTIKPLEISRLQMIPFN